MPQTPLFSADDLTGFLHREVTQAEATATERVVWGWLRPLLKVDARPASPSDEVVSWAIELGAIAYSNPEGLSEYQLESEKSTYSSERRDEILQMAAGGGVVAPGGVPSPKGNFPPATCYPDPAYAGRRRPWGWSW